MKGSLKEKKAALRKLKAEVERGFSSFQKKCKYRHLVKQKPCTCPPCLYCDCKEYGDWHECLHKRHSYSGAFTTVCRSDNCPRI